MLYTSNLYSAVYQLYLNKTEEKKFKQLIQKEYFHTSLYLHEETLKGYMRN